MNFTTREVSQGLFILFFSSSFFLNIIFLSSLPCRLLEDNLKKVPDLYFSSLPTKNDHR